MQHEKGKREAVNMPMHRAVFPFKVNADDIKYSTSR